MASAPEEPRSPALANVVVVAGFAVIFTTFLTDSPWSWIIGGGMLLAGALWAGAAPGPVTAGEVSVPPGEGGAHAGATGPGLGGEQGGEEAVSAPSGGPHDGHAG